MKTRILSLLLTLMAVAALAGCGGGSSAQTQTPTVDGEALLQTMMEADGSLPEMTTVAMEVGSLSPNSADYRDRKKTFSYISDLPFDLVDRFAVAYSVDGRKADEIAVIAVKDEADAGDALDSLRRHQEDRLKLYQTYGPQEAARVEKAQLFTRNQYAVLIICDDTTSVTDAFEHFLNGAAAEG